MGILLEPDEIDEALGFQDRGGRRVAIAQVKKFRDWGEGGCEHDPPSPKSICFKHGQKRKECPYCWQSFLKEIE